jgi:uncharacterized membrane protein HdeD (DUF308 family)
MIDLAINIVFVVLMLMIIIGTILEWRKTKRNLLLLPIVAYILGLFIFIGPFESAFIHPWIAGFAWLAIGLVVRVVVRRGHE